jgi:hypothetical protein
VWRTMMTVVVMAVVLGPRGASVTVETTQEAMAQEAESTFRSAMEAWAYEEYWRLWDMGTRISRSALPREDFTDRMRRGNTHPAAGKRIEMIQVLSTQPKSATVYVRFGVEDRRRSWVESTERPFLLNLEDGRWTVSLWDFVGLANYFPPDFFPNQPLMIPSPVPPGMRR